mmetsp:Transcript_14130/g.29301  ORF Transcript_14130/g.29301 Transcript_14130/m.29301 type:complete len:204 (+) Transcript_14130:78-689(+)|eukprot:CAMPEP_0196733976 /NCGR_PEP_ID=MMETSP1091-20130531/12839_1 /TAXON_ID=302021 /ORGANISM="Rhodomonas sp., Strain CCMP768" /LENGTH=203 /DNA_ID=CAMNT_0042077415 /DNA_START=55 /DNA_END=666 /DNA_ORIENTATION=+
MSRATQFLRNFGNQPVSAETDLSEFLPRHKLAELESCKFGAPLFVSEGKCIQAGLQPGTAEELTSKALQTISGSDFLGKGHAQLSGEQECELDCKEAPEELSGVDEHVPQSGATAARAPLVMLRDCPADWNDEDEDGFVALAVTKVPYRKRNKLSKPSVFLNNPHGTMDGLPSLRRISSKMVLQHVVEDVSLTDYLVNHADCL